MARRKKVIGRDEIISSYMNQTLENEQFPANVFKFCKELGLEETDFYSHFGSLEGVQQEIFNAFYTNTISLLQNSEDYPNYSNREKLLTFYYTMFEVLTANRSYVLYALSNKKDLKTLKQLSTLRSSIKEFATELVEQENEGKNLKVFKQSESVIAEATWVQFLFLLKFWLEDNSPSFEKTDAAIEKSVNTVFDLLNTKPLESLVDLGKFLWKEKVML